MENNIIENTKLLNLFKCIEDEFDQNKINELFEPVQNIINDKEKSLQKKLQMIHFTVVKMRKEFDSLSYYKGVEDRNCEINRRRYHVKNQKEKELQLQFYKNKVTVNDKNNLIVEES